MKYILSVIFLATTSLSFAQSPNQTATIEAIDSLMCPKGYASVGKSYPKFILSNESSTVNSQSIMGKVVLINFWFEGCHPCMAEMESLNCLFKKMENNRDFIFISLTWDNKETVKRVKERYGLAFEVFSAPTKECQRLNFGCGYPTSIILDKSGIVKYRYSGGAVKIEVATEFVEKTLLPKIRSLL